jgi:hypothetical protein
MKLFVHVGYAKCGSTSLQEALRDGTGILYPRSGRLSQQAEHLSLPLHLKGIDDYTRQWVSNEWVQTQHAALMREISESDKTVIVSSERLASLQPDQITQMAHLFEPYDTRIVVLYRDRENYLNSTWRHAVYNHDYAVDYPTFQRQTGGFDFNAIISLFEKHFPVFMFNIDDVGCDQNIMALTGASFSLRRVNVGVPFELAELLQRQHVLLGSQTFKAIFTRAVKTTMLASCLSPTRPEIAPFTDPLF